VGIGVLLGLGAIGNLVGGAPVTPTASRSAASQAVVATATATPRPVSTEPLGSRPIGPTEEARVVRVIDGDTIVVDVRGTEYHVRYIGMDTPEPGQSGAPQPMALEATAANEALVGGKTVILEKDVSETDRYDRLLRNVWVERDGTLVLVGLELVRTGFANVLTYPPDVRYADLLTTAVAEARGQAVGLWAVAATPAPTATPEPTPVLLVIDSDEPMYVDAVDHASFRGEAGTYTWTDVSFGEAKAVVRWDVRAASAACQIVWRIQPTDGSTIKRTTRVAGSSEEKGVERYATPFASSSVLVASTCPEWLVTMEGVEPPPVKSSNCHPSYSPCLPIVDDLDCPDVRALGKAPVTVKGPDDYRLDRDGDGIGCE
jgi:micrococcal nuclease